MTTHEFWAVIQQSRMAMRHDIRDGNMDLQEKQLEQLLLQRDPAEVLAFRDHFMTYMDRSYDYDLWAVAYILAEGVCSDDWFDYFRAWLISMGESAYEAALTDPAGVERLRRESRTEDIFFEQIMYVPGRVYQRKTGKPIPYADGGRIAMTGRQWQSDAEVREMFPDLYAKYLGEN